MLQMTCNYNRLDGGHCDRTGHRKMAVVDMGNGHGGNPWKFRNHVIVQETGISLCSVKAVGNEKEWWVSLYGFVFKLNWISILSWISDWPVHSGSYFSIQLGTLRLVLTTHCVGRQGLRLITEVRPVELAQWSTALHFWMVNCVTRFAD